MLGITCNQELAADRIRRFAVHAGTGLCAGCIQAKTLGIDRRGYIACSLHSAVNIIADFIHAHDEYNFFRSLGNGRYTIGIAIDINEHTIFCYGINAC